MIENNILKNNIEVGKYLAILVALLLLSTVVSAHQGAKGVVKERMMLMKGIGKDMKQMKKMVNGKVPFNAGKFAKHIQNIKLKSPHILELFPQGSLQHPTEARPSIWKKWDEFESLNNRLITEAEELERSLLSKDLRVVGKQVKKVGKVCFSCHKKFRKKKK